MLSLEPTLPERVTRNDAGIVTMIDRSAINLFRRRIEGFDISMQYERKFTAGTLTVQGTGSAIQRMRNQYLATSEEYDSAGFPSEGGAAKYKANAGVSWETSNWNVGWTGRFFGSYKQYGAAGGPESMQYNGGAQFQYYIAAQGSDEIASQIYHDIYASYQFGDGDGKANRKYINYFLKGLRIQLGVRNLMNERPPLDVFYSYYTSPYGDRRLRSFWISVRKGF